MNLKQYLEKKSGKSFDDLTTDEMLDMIEPDFPITSRSSGTSMIDSIPEEFDEEH